MTAVRTRTPLPPSMVVRELIEGLLGRDVTVSPGDPVMPRAGSPAAVAVYTDAQLQMRAVMVVDLPLAAGIGAGLGLLPTGAVGEAVQAGELPDSMSENVHEVFNVAASVFNVGDSPHLTLYQVIEPGKMPPVDVSVM